MRRGAEAARRAHNPEVVGSNPTAATISLLDTVPMALGLQSMHFRLFTNERGVKGIGNDGDKTQKCLWEVWKSRNGSRSGYMKARCGIKGVSKKGVCIAPCRRGNVVSLCGWSQEVSMLDDPQRVMHAL